MTKVAFILNDEHERFIHTAVNTGAFASESEVVATALDILKTREELWQERRAEIRQEIQKGIGELDRGAIADFDLRTFLDGINARKLFQAP